MPVPRFFTRQLGHPSGLMGRHVMGRLLNRVNAPMNAMVLEALQVRTGDRVLEVGFGGAALLEDIAAQASDGFVAGVELSEEMLEAASKRLRPSVDAGLIELRQGAVDSLPYADADFDKACSANTIYFWPDLEIGLRELARVIKPGGSLVVGFSPAEEMRRVGLDQRGFTLYSPHDLRAAVESTGFEQTGLTSRREPRGTSHALTARRLG